nr:melanoma-associated antigen B5-like [Cavia porcellus]
MVAPARLIDIAYPAVPAAQSILPTLLVLSSFIMPRGHKSKHRAHQKRPKGRGVKQGDEVAQETVAPIAEATAATEVEGAAAAGVEAAAPAPAAKAEAAEVDVAAATAKQATPQTAAKAESLRGAASCSPSLTPPRRSPSAGSFSADGSVVSFGKSSSCKYEECLSETSHCPEYLSEDTKCPIETLQWFILNKFHLKQPFTRIEMLLSVNRKYRGEFPKIFKFAREHLEAMFAVEMREVESTRHSYNLFSMLSLPNNGRIRPGRGYPKTGLLMKILALILMKDHRASEEDIWKFLKKLQVYPGKKHIFFGNANRLLTHDFVRLKYLEYQQVPGCLLPRREFLWGPQAHAEISKEKIMQFLIRINEICPTYFSYLYEDLGKVEIEKFQALLSSQHVSTGKPSLANLTQAKHPASAKPADA